MRKRRNSILLEVFAILLFLIYMLPFLIILINASKPSLKIIDNPLSLPTDPSVFIDNVQKTITSPNVRYVSSFISSIIITIVSVGLLALITSMAAWVLVRTKTKLSGFIFMIFVAAMVIPFQVVMFPLISWFHLVEVKLNLSAQFRLLQNYPGIILAYLGFGTPMSVFLFHGFIKGVPLEIEESATIDGCSRSATFFKIVFPILKPITVTVIILNGIWIWNDFLLPMLVLGSGNAVQTLPLAVANFVGSFLRKWDLILTSTIMAMLPIVILFLILQKHIIKGMMEGSVKG